METKRLEAILKYCQENQIRAVLVKWPNLPEYQALFARQKYAQAMWRKLRMLSRQYQAPIIQLAWNDFKDTTGLFHNTRHLSADGAKYYTALLVQKLLDLPDIKQVLGVNGALHLPSPIQRPYTGNHASHSD